MLKVKVIYSYEEIIEDVTKIVPDQTWNSVSIYTKTGLHSIPNHCIQEIVFLDDDYGKDN